MWFEIICSLFGLNKMVFRGKLVLWIGKSMRAAFAGCETDPVPTNFINLVQEKSDCLTLSL
jgi:hypothetical protein